MGADVLVVGMDALDPELIDRWEASLPNLSAVYGNGLKARLASTYPPVTGVAWPSLMTGKNPAKTSLSGFEKHGNIVNRGNVQSRCLWELIDDAGLEGCSIGIPLSYPPDDLEQGVVLSGSHTPPDADDWVSPPDLASELPDPTFGTGHEPKDVLLDAIEQRMDVSLALLERRDWDAFVTVFMESDRAGHSLLEPSPDGEIRGYDDLEEVYEALDDALGRLREAAAPANVVVLSDHGFGRAPYKRVNVNNWLEEQGYMAVADDGPTVSKERVEGILDRLNLATALPAPIKRFGRRILPSETTDVEDVAPDSRLAYRDLPNGGGFRILDPDLPVDRVVEEVRSITDPDTGDPIFDRVRAREDVYEGPHVEDFPEVLVIPGDAYRPRPMHGDSFVEPIPENALDKVIHKYHGVFLADGADFASIDGWADSMEAVDVTPTLLHLLGVPVPEDADGTVRSELFAPGSDPATTDVAFGDPSRETRTREDDDSDEVRDRLEDLGYL